MSDKDRINILEVFEEMFDGVDGNGIYPTTVAYGKVEKLIEDARMEAIGWAYADCCSSLDSGDDPRQTEMSDVVERAKEDLVK